MAYRCKQGHDPSRYYEVPGLGEWRCRQCSADAQRARRAERRAAGKNPCPADADRKEKDPCALREAIPSAPPPPTPDDVEIVEEPRDPLADTQESEPVVVDEEGESPRSGESAAPIYNAPAVHTSRTRGEAFLVVSDTQEPYSCPGALSFVLAVAREFGVDLTIPGRAYHVGDEIDGLNFSRFARSPEAPHTPNQELAAVVDRLRPWYAAIPHLRLCKSNHGDRVLRRAFDAGLPSQLLRAHRDVIEAPPTWEWANDWRVPASRQPFLVEHGHHGGQSTAASRQRPAWNGINTAWGHMHAQAGVWHVKTHGQQVWGMCVGSLIDREAVAFEYGKPNTWQPWLGCGVVLDGGRMPVLIPYGGSWP